MKFKKDYLKYLAIALAIVFLLTAALMLVKVWEKRQGKFPAASTEDSSISYEDKQYVPKKNIDTLLVLGLDKYEGATSADSHESGVQADFLMLFVFDDDAKQCTAVQINRDTMTSVNKLGIGGTKVDTFTRQIALSYSYVIDNNDKVRCKNTKDSVEKLLNGIKVNHYMSVTMDCVTAMNDLVGGVKVTVLDDFTGLDDTLVKGETVTLMGEQALRYVRSRYGLEDSTNVSRMERQRQYIDALYDTTVSRIESDDGFLITLVDTVDDYVVYDSSNSKMQKMAEKFEEYEFLGIREIEGEARPGEEFMEFYPDGDSINKIVMDLFYTVKDE